MCFTRPIICHFEAPLTIARAVIYKDASITPISGPVCDVITVAKRDLKEGEVMDGIGGFTCYGMLENSDVVRKEDLLPMGLSEGCCLKNNVSKDSAIRYEDVRLPLGRLCDKLWIKQNEYFSS